MVALAANTWGISGPHFLLLYGAVCAVWAGGLWLLRRHLLGPSGTVERQEPDVYELAVLNDGPELAITAAAARLSAAGVIEPDDQRHTLRVSGSLPADANPLEREVFEAVYRLPGITNPPTSIGPKTGHLTKATQYSPRSLPPAMTMTRGLILTLPINGKRSRAASHPSEDAPSVAARRRERVLHAEGRAVGGGRECLQSRSTSAASQQPALSDGARHDQSRHRRAGWAASSEPPARHPA
jgi:hypothetical protein